MLWQWLIVGAIVFACLSVAARRAYRFGTGWFRLDSPPGNLPACSGCSGCRVRGNAQPGNAKELPLVALGTARGTRANSESLPTNT